MFLTFINNYMYLQYVLFTFVYNSLISVMPYKVYNELPGVGTAAKKPNFCDLL